MANHTPGPWLACPGDTDFNQGWYVVSDVRNLPSPIIVRTCYEAGIPRREDARLIACAPEILEALKEAREDYILTGVASLSVVKRMEAVIARAEGVSR